MPPDRRNERAQRTRQRLIDASLDLFERRGFDATTVDQIAEAAGVAPRTFFHHFGTKEGVLFSGYADRLDEATQRLRDCGPEVDPWSALEHAASAVVEAMEQQPELFLRRGRLYADEPALRATMLVINEEWIDGLRAEISARLGVGEDDLRPRILASVANSSMRAAIELWTAAEGRLDLAALCRQAFELARPAGAGATVPVPVGRLAAAHG